jgi:hypothetical protein
MGCARRPSRNKAASATSAFDEPRFATHFATIPVSTIQVCFFGSERFSVIYKY